MTNQSLAYMIKTEAQRLDFSACGIAKAEPVDENVADNYIKWLELGNNAGMDYMCNNIEKRLDPTLLMPGAKSIVSLAMSYYPEQRLKEEQCQFAYYSYGKDYHDVIKQKLFELSSFIQSHTDSQLSIKPCVDTVPILDRYWAWKAGIGWIGKNTNLIIPKAGSFFFLAELLLDVELDYDSPMDSYCGRCTRCVDSCPTGALCEPYSINANKCLSYLTIEHRGSFENTELNSQYTDRVVNKSMTDEYRADDIESTVSPSSSPTPQPYIYGCDCCQLACPYNRFAEPTKIKEFIPSDEFLSMQPSDWQSLSIEQYRTLFKGSAVKRAKYEGLIRNINYFLNIAHDESSGEGESN